MAIETRNPATGAVEKTFEPHSDAAIDAAIAASVAAGQQLKKMSFAERAQLMHKAADIVEARATEFAKLMTLEMGKPLAQAEAEAKKCAWVCRYYADEAEALLADDMVQTGASKSYRKYLPLGPVLAVMPWNYPFWQVFRFAAPALMAGNTGLLKHASNVPQCALAIENIFTEAGFPKGAFQTLLIGSDKVETILRDPRVRAATLTGSEPAGAAVAAICGEEIKPVVLELGGSDPFIVMPSADMEAAISTGLKARVQNNGQSCIAAKRFLVHSDIYEDFKARLTAEFEALSIGDPMKAETDIGPLVNAAAVDEVVRQVDNAVQDGARIVTGCVAKDGPGHYFVPGILENIPKTSNAYHEEIFAPVALLFEVGSLDDAISVANESPFGLGSAIFTQDTKEQGQAIRDIEAGATFVNAMTSSDPRLPFGGIKRSGIGRELASEGIRAFCNTKTVSIA